MNLVLLGAGLATVAWIVFGWIMPVGVPAIHLLLAVAAILVVYGVGRWR